MASPDCSTAPPLPSLPTLYTRPYSSSGRVTQLLLELSIAPTVVAQHEIPRHVLTGDADFLSRNPQARVPFFEDPASNIAMVESGAIMQLILEKYDLAGVMGPRPDQALSATAVSKRAQLLQWLHYGPATAWPVVVQLHGLVHQKNKAVGDNLVDKLIGTWQATVVKLLRAALVDERKFILGDEFSAADISLSCDFMCAAHSGLPGLIDDPIVSGYWGRLRQRASFKAVYPGFD